MSHMHTWPLMPSTHFRRSMTVLSKVPLLGVGLNFSRGVSDVVLAADMLVLPFCSCKTWTRSGAIAYAIARVLALTCGTIPFACFGLQLLSNESFGFVKKQNKDLMSSHRPRAIRKPTIHQPSTRPAYQCGCIDLRELARILYVRGVPFQWFDGLLHNSVRAVGNVHAMYIFASATLTSGDQRVGSLHGTMANHFLCYFAPSSGRRMHRQGYFLYHSCMCIQPCKNGLTTTVLA